MIALDTNVVIAAINRRLAHVRARLDAEIAAGGGVAVPAIVLFEMHYGCAKSQRRAQAEAALQAFLSLDIACWPFETEDAADAGDIRGHLDRQGTPIGYYDILIAAQARLRGAVLVTANQREFARVPGLTLQDWRLR